MLNPQYRVLERNTDLTALTEAEWQSGCIIPFDKPLDWSSFDVIRFIRKSIPVKKVGHAGTLDPRATGVLVICTGKATKYISELQNTIKEYHAVIRIGVTSPSLDTGTEDTEVRQWVPESIEHIKTILADHFIGDIEQLPPAYSALKINGQRAYHLVRKGLTPDIKPRIVHIESIQVLKLDGNDLSLTIKCGKGTYIRSIARDIGDKLNTVSRLESLCRTASGALDINKAWDPGVFKNQMNRSNND